MVSVAFIGAGNMAYAIAKGSIQGQRSFSSYTFCDLNDFALKKAKSMIPECKTTKSAAEAAKDADVIIMALKPQYCKPVLKEMGPHLTEKQLIITIMAGVTIRQIRDGTGSNVRIIRVMPNMPLMALMGATAFSLDKSATKEDEKLAHDLFEKMGFVCKVAESMLNKITSVSSCSPAFVALFIDAIADAGVVTGLPRDLAVKLAANAVYGAAGVLAKTDSFKSPMELRDAVCSPGGSSVVGVITLEKNRFRAAVIDAVLRSTERNEALSKI